MSLENERKAGSRPKLYPELLATRVPEDVKLELQYMALFDKKSLAAWLRDLAVTAMKRYQRNPQYKSWRKQVRAIRGPKAVGRGAALQLEEARG